jgi:hypothetical protein
MAGVTERHLWSPAARMNRLERACLAHDHVIPIIATKHRVDRCSLDMPDMSCSPAHLLFWNTIQFRLDWKNYVYKCVTDAVWRIL